MVPNAEIAEQIARDEETRTRIAREIENERFAVVRRAT